MHLPNLGGYKFWFFVIILPGAITVPLQQPSNSSPSTTSVAILDPSPAPENGGHIALGHDSPPIPKESLRESRVPSSEDEATSASRLSDEGPSTTPTSPFVSVGFETDEYTELETKENPSQGQLVSLSESIDDSEAYDFQRTKKEDSKAFANQPDHESSIEVSSPPRPPLESEPNFIIQKRTAANKTNPSINNATVAQGPTDMDVKHATELEEKDNSSIVAPTNKQNDEPISTAAHKPIETGLGTKSIVKEPPVSPRSPARFITYQWNIVCDTHAQALHRWHAGQITSISDRFWFERNVDTDGLFPDEMEAEWRNRVAECRERPCRCVTPSYNPGPRQQIYTCKYEEYDWEYDVTLVPVLAEKHHTCWNLVRCRCEVELVDELIEGPSGLIKAGPRNLGLPGQLEPPTSANMGYWGGVGMGLDQYSSYHGESSRSNQRGVINSPPTEKYLVPGTIEPYYLSGPEEYSKKPSWSSLSNLHFREDFGSILSKRSADSENDDEPTDNDGT
ncbi:hypothetical protein TWF506_004599 [Arthrobotrys conoides]|uniref:Spaetzle domain-containing protein n=1 Tax=Arthrobotrys conoides TaxID=74498 RepID=A0AAN8N2D8_9PEZI